MGRKATDVERAAYADREHTLYRKFAQGERDPQYVLDGIQNLIEGKAFDQLTPSPSIFSTPEEILARFAFYAGSEGWPVEGLLDDLHDQMPTDYVSTLDHLLVLDVWLGDLPTTFEALAGWIEYEQKQAGNGYWRWDGLKSDPKHLRLLNPERYGHEPSVRWVELDMTANRGSRPKDVRSASSAGLQVMTAFAAHPAYPPAIDYEAIPGAWVAGLEADTSDARDWRGLPILHWNRGGREVDVSANRQGDRDPDYAVPEFREL